MANQEIRWRYRFANFSRAFSLLREALENGASALSDLEREGVVQRFEYTFELAWNTLKDRMEYDGLILPSVTPRAVIRQAFQSKLIAEGDVWIDMLNDRNLMSHRYDFATFRRVVKDVERRYLPILADMHARFLAESAE